jgi:hypothetical protein
MKANKRDVPSSAGVGEAFLLRWLAQFFLVRMAIAKGVQSGSGSECSAMDRFSRIVLGYHGCEPSFAEALLRGEVRIEDWQPSRNPYDWLGHGIYFWEFAPHRAKVWSGAGSVVGAVIQLGLCLDLTDVNHTNLLRVQYKVARKVRRLQGLPMPKNKGKQRDLDCFIINGLVEANERKGISFQTVRCPFLEGRPAFPGSGILRESHIQVAVRHTAAILGVFRPNLS